MGRRRYFGSVRRLASGRVQARYTGPDGLTYTARSAGGGATFDTEGDADAALSRIRTQIADGTWVSPRIPVVEPAAPITLAEFAASWLADRDLAVRTREEYAKLLRLRLLPDLGPLPVEAITPGLVRSWYAGQGTTTPTARAHAYALLRTILASAASEDVIAANPCRIRGAGQTKAAKKTRPATLGELAALVAALPERYRMMAQLACWCSLRFGELTALQRDDVDLAVGLIRVRRSVVRTKAGMLVKAPKSEAGVRNVTIPPHVIEDLREHVARHARPGKEGLLFPSATGGYMGGSALHRVYGPARVAAGRPDLSFHDLRHTGQTYAAASGANLRELMARAGQSSPGAALRYLHEIDGRQREIADRLTAFAAASNVTPISVKKATKISRANRSG